MQGSTVLGTLRKFNLSSIQGGFLLKRLEARCSAMFHTVVFHFMSSTLIINFRFSSFSLEHLFNIKLRQCRVKRDLAVGCAQIDEICDCQGHVQISQPSLYFMVQHFLVFSERRAKREFMPTIQFFLESSIIHSVGGE